MNSLPKTVTLQRRGCDLNPCPTALESSTLTTRLPSHPYLFAVCYIYAMRGRFIMLHVFLLYLFCLLTFLSPADESSCSKKRRREVGRGEENCSWEGKRRSVDAFSTHYRVVSHLHRLKTIGQRRNHPPMLIYEPCILMLF